MENQVPPVIPEVSSPQTPPLTPKSIRSTVEGQRPYPDFHPITTLVCSIVAFSILGWIFYVLYTHEASPSNPEEYLNKVGSKFLDAEEFAGKAPHWQRWLNYLGQSPNKAEVLDGLISEYQKVDQYDSSHRIKKELTILLLEANRNKEVSPYLNYFSWQDPEFLKLLQFAYLKSEEVPIFNPRLEKGWIYDRLLIRFYEKKGETKKAASVQKRILKRGREYQDRISLLNMVGLGTSFAGLLLLFWFGKHGFSSLYSGKGWRQAPWRSYDFYAVVVRSITLLFILFPFLAWYWLIRPRKVRFRDLFDFSISAGQGYRFFFTVFAFFCIGCFGETLVHLISFFVPNVEFGILEKVPEEILGSNLELRVFIVLAVLMAPLLEEIFFRGFCYTSFRRIFSPTNAALLTAFIFSSLHGYSLLGFLAILWSGFLWAFLYEKTRNILLCICVHSLLNLFVVLQAVFLYRF